MTSTSRYGLEVTFNGSFEEAVVKVKEVFQRHGFGTLCEIDVRATLREKLGEEIEPYTILGVCNPGLASRALKAEPQIGLLLPCNLLVREHQGGITVSAQDPLLMVKITENLALHPIAEEAKGKILNALHELA
jgi:uncharacterized protein (DUF302 family)